MDLDRLAALLTPDGAGALAAAMDVADGDPLAASSALRAREIAPDLAATALTQAVLRRRAGAKFGADAAAMFFTRAGLEQATRAEVAARRAARLAASGTRTVADLGCGVGADTIAFARAGLRVLAVDADPLTAAVATASVVALGLADRVNVSALAAQEVALDGVDAVFCDPARRTVAGRRVFDPTDYSPPWDFVIGLTRRVPRTVLKLAPGIDHALIPPGAEAQWVSVRGEVVEAAFWCGPLAEVPRRATLLRGGEVRELTGSGEESAPVGPVRRYLYDPDGAVVRAHLVAEFAATLGGTLADPTIAYVYADSPLPTPYGRCLEVLEVLPFSLKRLRSALRARGAGRVTIAKRGSAVDVERLRRDLRLSGDAELTVVLTRVAGAQTALLCTPA
ncbi:MAG TPA: class I SAM-dependent methyltransferase [Planosporangium sp.]|nr:class I SAM-dependent methyltransferase [Planosporangium sp.]